MSEWLDSWGTMLALGGFVVASIWLGLLAHRVVEKGSFLKGYFLGNRAIGAWALALTATVQSGGTFMGFPSLVYAHGWVVALWIGSYMAVPITGFAIVGKRLAQLSRRTGAITIPDLFRERFASPTLGLLASSLIIFYMSFMMVAQFKAGALIMKIAWAGLDAQPPGGDAIDWGYYTGLMIFTAVVLSYTLIGGFLAAIWTDVLQSLMMLAGVMILLPLAIVAVGGLDTATIESVKHTGPGYVFGPGYSEDGRQFHTLGLAISFFFVWVFAGFGSPASVVRVMASKDTQTIRRSIIVLGLYNSMIYLPLIAICICARAVFPDLAVSDEVVPRMALWTTREMWGGSILAGVILAAPFGAVTSTVSAYLVVITSGFVRDFYQRYFRPMAGAGELRRLSYVVMAVVAAIAIVANLRPVAYLQAIVVFSGTSAAATFVVPVVMAAYWRRATAAGAMASMTAGSATMLALFAAGWISSFFGYDPMIGPATSFRPYYLLGMDPLVWGLAGSLIAGWLVSLWTSAPEEKLISQHFDRLPEHSLSAEPPVEQEFSTAAAT